jgi:Leucine-rich repeat (LRR) protein
MRDDYKDILREIADNLAESEPRLRLRLQSILPNEIQALKHLKRLDLGNSYLTDNEGIKEIMEGFNTLKNWVEISKSDKKILNQFCEDMEKMNLKFAQSGVLEYSYGEKYFNLILTNYKVTRFFLEGLDRDYFLSSRETKVMLIIVSKSDIILEIDNEFGDKLGSLKNLEALNLSRNYFTNLDFLKGLEKLQDLNLRDNMLRDIGGLKNQPKLKQLDLSQNLIRDIQPLQNLKFLESVDLSSNQIKDVSLLSHLEYLYYLDLSFNHIASLEQVQQIVAMPYLQTLKIKNNPVCEQFPPDLLDEEDNQLKNLREFFKKNDKNYKEGSSF